MSLLSDLVPAEAVLRRSHGLLEGPRISPSGELVYSDVLVGGLWACAPRGSVRELLPRRRGIGGVVPHADGGWVVSGRTVIHVSDGGAVRTLLADDSVEGYNDIFSTPDGDLLAGALCFSPFAGQEPAPGKLVRRDLEGQITVLTDEVIWPNGIGVSPDGAEIYLADYARQAVLVVGADGSGSDVLCSSPRGSADGLAVDAEGCVWLALGEGGGVARIRPDGELDELIDVPQASFVSSISFGGPDMCDVVISTADNTIEPQLGGVLLLGRSLVPGLPTAPLWM